jgi:hypothetical protein
MYVRPPATDTKLPKFQILFLYARTYLTIRLNIAFSAKFLTIFEETDISLTSALFWSRCAIRIATMLWASGFGVRILIRIREFSLLQNVQTVSGVRPASYSMRNGIFCRRQSSQGVKLSTHRHLVPRLKMSGSIPVLLLCAFMGRTWKTLLHLQPYLLWRPINEF